MTARMRQSAARRLLALYPPAWRARYGDEMRAMLDEHPATGRVLFDLYRSAARENLWPSVGDARSRRARLLRVGLLMIVSVAVMHLGQMALHGTTGRGIPWGMLNPFATALGMMAELYIDRGEAVVEWLAFWAAPVATALVTGACLRRFVHGTTAFRHALTALAAAFTGLAAVLTWMDGWLVIVSPETPAVVWLRLAIIFVAAGAIGAVVAWVTESRVVAHEAVRGVQA